MKESKKVENGLLLSRHARKHNGWINVVNARYASFRGMWDIREIGGRHRNEHQEYPAVYTCLQLETISKFFGIKNQVHRRDYTLHV